MTPGPTNTLMGLAGASAGIGRTARLIPSESLGYLTAIVPLALVGHSLPGNFPIAAQGIKLAAAAWVMVLAVKLWARGSLAQGPNQYHGPGVYVTTVPNPRP